jgi:predicted 3-demethylubiquinone-9 3-methyltransferase (glyoxalase superfamily)
MKNSIYPCIWFDGNAREAADLYCDTFGNSAVKSENPMVVIFELNGQKFMGLNGGPMFKPNPSISFFANCETPEEIETKWAALSEGGMIMMPLDYYPWSKEKYGLCQDKFGVSWQVMQAPIGGMKFVPALMFTQEKAGHAEDAMNFYTSIFDDAKITSISRYLPNEPDVEGTIKHAQFTLNGQYFVAFDSSAQHQFKFNEGVSLVVECDTQAEIDYFWSKLTEGGSESQCGWLKDKYGVSWQIVPTILAELMGDAEKSPRVIEAFMQMKKFDIKKLIEA